LGRRQRGAEGAMGSFAVSSKCRATQSRLRRGAAWRVGEMRWTNGCEAYRGGYPPGFGTLGRVPEAARCFRSKRAGCRHRSGDWASLIRRIDDRYWSTIGQTRSGRPPGIHSSWIALLPSEGRAILIVGTVIADIPTVKLDAAGKTWETI